MNTRLFIVLVILAATSVLSACKVAILVVEGGEVQSIGSGTCAEGTICIVEVNDTNFHEEFTAVPNSGWYFIKWNSGGGFLCQDSANPTCVVSNVDAKGNELVETVVASSQMFYVMPVFSTGRLITDTLFVNGKEWAQVDLFAGLSWDNINAVCPEGICIGVLNDYDMSGWTWASVNDVNALFNYYIGNDEMGPGPDRFFIDFPTSDAIFSDGWRGIAVPNDHRYSNLINGWVRKNEQNPDTEFEAFWFRVVDTGTNSALADTSGFGGSSFPPGGGWFYRFP